ncbi:MAG: 16S rRNA (guanine(527)-N(7))-methyltransferase RsmG [Rubrobacteraceae bacterium]
MKHPSGAALDLFFRQSEAWGVEVSGVQGEMLLAYARELSGYEKANVIGVKDIDAILLEHVLDSLSCFAYGPLRRAESLVDVGSGGGLPGVPIKILGDPMKVALVEATGKKAVFLRQVVERLDLDGIEVVNARVENVGRDVAHRGVYDAATVRAVSKLDVILEYCVPLVKLGGSVICMKADLAPTELSAGSRAAKKLGAKIQEVVEIPFVSGVPPKKRRLVVVRKLSKTPAKYPRITGVPGKTPLGVEKK